MPADLGKLRRDLEREKSNRAQHESIWQEVAELVMPSRATFTARWGRGQLRSRKILDSAAEQANEVWAEGMQGNMISRQTRWFYLQVPDARIMQSRRVKVWLADVTDVIYSILNDPRSNFYAALSQVFLDLGAFGSSVLYMPERDDDRAGRGVSFRTRFIGETYLMENMGGRVDGLMFEEDWSLSDLMEEFGKEKLPAPLVEMIAKDKTDLNKREHQVVHSVVPRDDRSVESLIAANMPWASVWWMPKHNHSLRESGYREFPFAVPRLSQRTGERYGVGIGVRMLPDIRMLQRMWETVIKAAQKSVDPPLMVPDDSFIGPVRTMPGGLNYYRSGTDDKIMPLLSGARPDIGQELLDKQREKIRTAWFNDVFDMTGDSSGVNVKAAFVDRRRRDKMMRLAPMFSLLEPDLLDAIITRTYAVAARQGMLPDVPAELQNSSMDVTYQSAISRAQRSSEVDDIFALMDVVAPMAQSDPSILQNIDGDQLVQHAGGDLLNISPRILRDPEAVAAMRAKQQQDAQLREAAQLAPGVAGALKDVSQAQQNVQ